MYYKKINSKKNKHIKLLKKLKKKKYRKKFNLALIEGWNIIFEAFKQNVLVEILTIEKNKQKFEKFNNISLIISCEKILTNLSQSKNNKNIIGVINLNKINKKNNFKLNKNILLLENIQDPGNLGTLIRAGVAFNFTNIILFNNSIDIFNFKVLCSSQGAIFKVAIKKVNLIEIKKLQLNNYKLITTVLNKKNIFLQYFNIKQNENYILALGNEGNGISSTLKNISDYNIEIKINSELESLNVSQSGAILMYEINKQIRNK